MKTRHLINIKWLLIVCFVFLVTSVGNARSLNDIKQSMAKRAPVINALKSQGVVGENNKGFLEFVGQKKEKQSVVTAENQDREKVYRAIAKQQKTTVKLVGKHRAIQIAAKAQPGEWLQDAGGKWYQKE